MKTSFQLYRPIVFSLCVLFLSACSGGSGADSGQSLLSISRGNFIFSSSLEEIPADVDRFIAVGVEVNGVLGLFVLDSGSDFFIVSPSFADRAALLSNGTTQFSTVLGDSELPVRRITQLRVANLEVSDFDAIEADVFGFDGVIGAPFFQEVIVGIDFVNAVVTIADPENARVRPPPDRADADFVEIDGLILRNVTVNGQSIGPLRVDTGSVGGIHTSQAQASGILDSVSETRETNFTTVNGTDVGQEFIADTISIGGFQLSNQIVLVQDRPLDIGLLGNSVLGQYTIVLNLRDNEFLLIPERSISFSLDRTTGVSKLRNAIIPKY